MLQNFNIGKRLSAAFAIVLCFVLLVAATGLWGLGRAVKTTLGILSQESKLTEHALGASNSALGLRRFEKDLFLNIGDRKKEAEYLEKWEKEKQELLAHLDVLEKTTTLQEDKEAVRSLRADFGAYDAGLQGVVQKMGSGEIKTSTAANLAIGTFKDEIRRLDANSEAFAIKNVERIHAKEAVVLDAEKSTRTVLYTATLCAVFLAFLVTVLITRSITRPILEVVAVARRLAEGDSEQAVAVKGRDETGELLGAMSAMVESNK
ncbi:MAG TPA: HAMP domain-containing protein, partial [Thermoanaerobaculia bacterium]|nr:HAMP domain-containing protein [Thermoanaerobaculia bacterium]